MNKRQWGKVLTTIFWVVVLVIAGAQVLDAIDYLQKLDEETTNSRTQTLVDGPVVPEIICTDQRGTEHMLRCRINTGEDGLWLVQELIEGEAQRGRVSNFLMSSWSAPIGSSVSPDIVVTYMSDRYSKPVQLIYKMDTSYMRMGVENFSGPSV